MEAILQDYFNGLCCAAQPTNGLNRFTFLEGKPSLEDMETRLGFALLNPRLDGNTWHFDNVGYSVPNNAFESSNMTGVVFADGVLGIGNSAFESNEITNLVIPNSITTIGYTSFSRNKIGTLTLGSGLTTIGQGAFQINELTTLNVNCATLGATTGIEYIFGGNTGREITINALAVHATSNEGGLEGDLQYLVDNNSINFNWI